jgi:hypothetical protein
MSALAFDTHAYVKKLVAVGITEAQAEVFANEQVKLMETHLATKDDIADVRKDIVASEQRVTIRLGGTIMAASGLLFAAIKLFGH